MSEFDVESKKTHGCVLIGKYKHWCLEWDQMPIDETCLEFYACGCYPPSTELKKIKEELGKELDKINENS